MSSQNLDKVVKLACKPKNAPPKPKVSPKRCYVYSWSQADGGQYVDVLVAATYSDDGSLNDICRSLSLRLRETNGVVRPRITLYLALLCAEADTRRWCSRRY